jgi:nucleoside-diphosphate-sugar epimerase
LLTVSTIAITGGTGFLGSCLIRLTLESGGKVRALTRRAQPPRANLHWVHGDLHDARALTELCEGADEVVHAAGTASAPDLAGYAATNIEGTANLVAAAERVGARFVHVSSLAARWPHLSTYAWSKAKAERIVEASPLNWAIVRAPVIYGCSGARVHPLFALASCGITLIPAAARVSLIEVGDFSRLLLAFAADSTPGTFEADDGTVDGWAYGALIDAIEKATRTNIIALTVPRLLLAAGERLHRVTHNSDIRFKSGRLTQFCHRNWVIDSGMRPAASLWIPRIETLAGINATAAWYRERGLL